MNIRSKRPLAITALAVLSPAAWAHDGHGLLGGHWHATDVWGFIGLGIALAMAVWLMRGGK